MNVVNSIETACKPNLSQSRRISSGFMIFKWASQNAVLAHSPSFVFPGIHCCRHHDLEFLQFTHETAMHWCILCHPLKSGFVRRRLLCSLTCCRSQTFLLTQLPPFFSKLFIFPLKAISILVEASQRIFQTLLLNQHKSVAFGYFLLIFSLHFHDLCAPHPRLCILAVIPPTSVTTISISWAAVSELQGPTFPFLLECEDLQEAQLVPFLPPPLFCAKLFLLKSSIFPCPTSKSVSMFLILEATHLLSKVRFYTPPAKKKNVAAIFPSKLIIVGQSNTPHTDSVFWVTSEPTLTNREKKHSSHCTLRLCNETVIGVLQPTWLEAVNYKHDHTLTHTLKVHLISWQRMGISRLQAVLTL